MSEFVCYDCGATEESRARDCCDRCIETIFSWDLINA
jgi:NMD protein affecting ribosome stability and mRNA decay